MDKNPAKITRTITNEVGGFYGYIENLSSLIKEVTALVAIIVIVLLFSPTVAFVVLPIFIALLLIYFKIIKPFIKKATKKIRIY